MGLPAARILQAFYCKREKNLVSDYYQLLGVDRKATDKELNGPITGVYVKFTPTTPALATKKK